MNRTGTTGAATPGVLARDPWRIFFPLALALAWAGVFHWIPYGAGATDAYRAVFHATAQIEGFLTALAAGFLLTFVPRRTGRAPASAGGIAVIALALAGATGAAWLEWWAAGQLAWLLAVVALGLFVARRLWSPGVGRRLPPVFLWVPAGLAGGAAGALLVAAAAIAGPREAPLAWRLGRDALFQGLFTALVVGVGGAMLPTLTRGEPAREGRAGDGPLRAVHLAAAALFFATFALDGLGAERTGLALRGALAGAALVGEARLWRPVTAPGLHRWLIWLAAWLVPGGLLAAAALPGVRAAALHVLFVGGFGLLALAVSIHVAVSHSGRPGRLAGRPWQVQALGLLLLAALGFRLLAGLDAGRVRPWLLLAAASFLLATLAWGALVVPALRAAAPQSSSPGRRTSEATSQSRSP